MVKKIALILLALIVVLIIGFFIWSWSRRDWSTLSNDDEPLLKGLRDRRAYIKGRCRLCKFFDACGGSLRVRADLHFDDPWAPDPGCYVTDEQIGLDAQKQQELIDSGEVFQMPD